MRSAREWTRPTHSSRLCAQIGSQSLPNEHIVLRLSDAVGARQPCKSFCFKYIRFADLDLRTGASFAYRQSRANTRSVRLDGFHNTEVHGDGRRLRRSRLAILGQARSCLARPPRPTLSPLVAAATLTMVGPKRRADAERCGRRCRRRGLAVGRPDGQLASAGTRDPIPNRHRCLANR